MRKKTEISPSNNSFDEIDPTPELPIPGEDPLLFDLSLTQAWENSTIPSLPTMERKTPWKRRKEIAIYTLHWHFCENKFLIKKGRKWKKKTNENSDN
ncbi:hypothetical protein AVEN_49818-1 [Araneus ventricosus]|uniref:Uncharacterized protein n=1 Tax=Araneus ventricosus TaxID=182803 RepID=A0A4Y2JLY9_ARAVE|nr:hypothetical protein AVEN_49818-1 [Araneus ventricosus]